MKFFSSKSAMHSLVAVILLLLHIKSTSPTVREDESEVVRFAQENALQNALLSVAKQKPRKCQIYSRLTRKHIQIYKKRVVARGEDGNPYSIIEKTSQTFGVVTIKGVKANRYLCMNSRGKLVAKKHVTPDRSCWFREIIEQSYFTSFVNFKYGSWYIGFSRHGKAKKGNKTTQNQVACNFLVRNLEKAKIRPQKMDTILESFAAQIRLKILKDRHNSLSRRRRHRFQTEYPMDTQHIEEPTDFAEEHNIAKIPGWLNNPPSNASSQKRTEWIIRATEFVKKHDYSLDLNTTGLWDSITLMKPSNTPLQSPKGSKKKRKNGKRKKGGKAKKSSKSATEKNPSNIRFLKVDEVEVDKDRGNTTASPDIKTVAQKTPLLSKIEPDPENLSPATRSGGGGKRHGKGNRARKKGKKIMEILPGFQDNNNKNNNNVVSSEKFDKDIFLRTVEPSITTIISNTLDVKRARTNRGKHGQKNARTRKRPSPPRT